MSVASPPHSKRKRRVNGAIVPDRRPQGPAADTASRRPAVGEDAAVTGLRPWHFVLALTALAVVASVVATSRTSTINTVSIAAAVAAAGLVAAAFFRSVLPFVEPESSERTEMLGGQTRAAIEREKTLVLRAIKELEFDRAMRKVSDADYHDMMGRLRIRAAGLMRQLDGGGAGYRGLIEKELAARLAGSSRTQGAPAAPPPAEPEPVAASLDAVPAPGTCAACGGANDLDARFCKSCGSRLIETGAV